MVSHIASLGWAVVGVDISADQLRVAEQHVGDVAEELVQAETFRGLQDKEKAAVVAPDQGSLRDRVVGGPRQRGEKERGEGGDDQSGVHKLVSFAAALLEGA